MCDRGVGTLLCKLPVAGVSQINNHLWRTRCACTCTIDNYRHINYVRDIASFTIANVWRSNVYVKQWHLNSLSESCMTQIISTNLFIFSFYFFMLTVLHLNKKVILLLYLCYFSCEKVHNFLTNNINCNLDWITPVAKPGKFVTI